MSNFIPFVYGNNKVNKLTKVEYVVSNYVLVSLKINPGLQLFITNLCKKTHYHTVFIKKIHDEYG